MKFVLLCLFTKILNSEKCVQFQRKYVYHISFRVTKQMLWAWHSPYTPEKFSQTLTLK